MTADRWAEILGGLGHQVSVASHWEGNPADFLVALHARKSHGSVVRFRTSHPDRPIVVALTGTDLYRDMRDPESEAWESAELADGLVVLQEKAPEALPEALREKTRVIYQSAPELWERWRERREGIAGGDAEGGGEFQIALLAHLRPVKDPLLAARAARRLPDESTVRIVHCGAAMSPDLEIRAKEEMTRNPRYLWLGEVARAKALRILEQSRLLVLTSRLEGAGNVISEALSAGVPIACTRVDGLVGMLGEDYPGYFPVGDATALAALLRRAETEPAFYRWLHAACARRAPLVDPEREGEAWRELLEEVGG